ncbi:MAG: hypothetical protein GYA34_04940 [Chloroflexi bacterium]|nr:hypothetical protein [Chloroflexota bacterium]
MDEKEYRNWRTCKMSDHLLIWVELNVDFGSDYLMRKTKVPEDKKRLLCAIMRSTPQ